MTEELEIVDQGANPESEPQGVTADDMLHKAIVSKIVERERLKAYEKGKQEALMQLQQEQQAVQQQPEGAQLAQQTQQPGNPGGEQLLKQEDVERLIAERTPAALMNHVNQLKQEQMINSFVSKMQASEERHPGLEAKLNELEYSPGMVKVIEMANNMENTADVMKELIDNPSKLIDMINLTREQPRLASTMMASLSGSIRQNQEALAQEKQAQDPMSQLKPSTSAGIDNSTMSVSDFRKMFRG